ncbi:MAG: Na/Pi cotransporter family protein [Bacillota bacterium]|nr:Na/Pi cotransporter family protein [Bacillota bacterium]
MNFFSLLSLAGGLALFLYGMHVMSTGLEKVAGGRLERTLAKLTDNPLKGVLLGAAVTAVIQSSSATTVMVVGFVNSGIMQLTQSAGIIMGANVGTTVTAWILSLTALESDNFIVTLFKPTSFSPIFALIGAVLLLFSKKRKKNDIGTILVGFAVLMYGMSAMSNAVEPLAEVPEFSNILLMFSNPLLGVLAGTLLTAVIQSSSASVGILQALCITGSVTYGSAIPIIMGQNIGTCATALISCIGATKNAQRTAMVHLYFNIIGAALFLGLFYLLNWALSFHFIDDSVTAFEVALIHTIFNLLSTIVLLPFSRLLCRMAEASVKEKEAVSVTPFLDERFLNTPSFAVEQCDKTTLQMAELSISTLKEALQLAEKFEEKTAESIYEKESTVDIYEDRLGGYLVRLSSLSLSEKDSHRVAQLLHAIGDFERISDHAVNIMQAAKEMHDKRIHFSPAATEELQVITTALRDILELTLTAFREKDLAAAAHVEPLEEVIDGLRDEIKLRHIHRLQSGICTIELGFILSDMLTNFERVSDHCSNIAVALLQSGSEQGSHQYLNELKASGQEFQQEFRRYRSLYTLPPLP